MHRVILRVGVFACLLAAAAGGTTLPRLTTKDLVKRAERVCCAKCDHVEARRDPRTGIVFTHVRLRLLEDLKGRSETNTIQLRVVGGRVGNAATVVPGMPTFRPNEESVLFLGARNREGFRVVLQARRGVVPLRRDKKGQRYLSRAVTGLPGLDGKRRVPIDDFRAAVQRVVREEARR